ncbi:hypothetical protein EX30DRAFT_193437 [Ascodesmis nigricans]|uniref:SH3 domain-containing protein n=1 Tax=Ascodesmis nigricans TaxID=341454 RepID=A0A4S2N0Y6_9PEZI|nr:hypothetical protein EX30DRAFT_193437 [Ascodesmis nigricans]
MATPDPPFKVKALYDYSSGHADDLQFATDDIITVTAIEDEDWYYGQMKDKATGELREGIFPNNFVERVKVEVPARPVRRKVEGEGAAPPPPPPPPPPQEEEEEEEKEGRGGESVAAAVVAPPPPPPVEEPPKVVQKVEEVHAPVVAAAPPVPKPTPAPAPPLAEEKKEKPPPPDKPSSFKDRLALFNKGGAAPIAPFQPKPRTDFIKKPFVPPPPSKNSYVPPPVSHAPKPRREEDTLAPPPPPPENTARTSGEFERDAEENKPKQSLKERIALLQTQSLGGHVPGEKKRPPKPKRAPSEASHEGETLSPESVEAPEKQQRQKKSLDIRREELHEDSSSVEEPEPPSAIPEPRIRHVTPQVVAHQSDFGDDEGANDTPDQPSEEEDEEGGEEEEEEEEIDPELARKIALRERMMKMSGGMGMHGVFGPPMGMPPPAPVKKVKKKNEKSSHEGEREEPSGVETTAPPVPLPFVLPRVQPPPAVEKEPEHEMESEGKVDVADERAKDVAVDVEDLRPTERQHPQGPRPMPAQRPQSPLAQEERAPPPPPPAAERAPPPPPPAEVRAPPPPPPVPAADVTESAGSQSDDELSEIPSKMTSPTASTASVLPPPPPPPTSRPGTSGQPMSPTSPQGRRPSQGYFEDTPTSPTLTSPKSPGMAGKRMSYQRGSSIPPIPGGLPAPAVARPPPPPPPSAPHTDDHRSDTEEEVTEYEADYDTDMANKVAHRDALTAQHKRDVEDDTPIPSPAVSPPQVPNRAVPPPPPMASLTQQSAPPKTRQSVDMPRALPPNAPPPARPSVDMPRAPPPAPPPQPPVETHEEDSDEYDPYRYDGGSRPAAPPPPPPQATSPIERPATGRSQPRRSMDAPRAPPSRGSMDTSRPGTRRSMDQSRPHISDYIARDLDLSPESHWWTTPNTLPPALAARQKDLIFETEESSTSRRGGRITITRDLYILFHDYSQTVLTVRYDRDDPISSATFEQRHEPPPPQPRQDQLEDASAKFGAVLLTHVKAREHHPVADSSPHALITDAFTAVPTALPPIGHRAFGALVYSNLANATVLQYDEIRPGDIVTFRNARFQGHKGGLHQKYSMDVGKPEHVAVVVDWDGTKKKVRALEQGREKRKVTVEGYRMADLRSGEVKVWRVVGRGWVGWE